jgi:predicted  nucleic acid-binding Zn-ribbon protein
MNWKLFLLFAALCLVSACALEPGRGAPPVTRVIAQQATPSEADQLLAYIAQTRQLDARGLARERDQLRSVFEAQKTEFTRVKLALLLASNTAVTSLAQDDTELILLLEPMVHRDNAPNADFQSQSAQADTRALAALMYGLAQDRKKLRDQLREAQARINALRRNDAKEIEARALRARVEELERNLAALKSIDLSVNRRTDAQRGEPPRVEPTK